MIKQGLNRLKMPGMIILCFAFSMTYAQMREACKLHYYGDPVGVKDSNIIAPDEVVAFSNKVKVNMPITTNTRVAPCAIFFVIDNSSSMSWESGKNDQLGSRFRVTHDLIDTIKNRFDTAEVGVGVFQRHLFFRPEVDQRFAKCPTQDSGSYIPLLKLDSSYAPDGKLGYDFLRQYLDTALYTKNATQYVDLQYQPVPPWPDSTSPGTCINAGFEAAKHAFKSSKYPKNRHFIIFLSDGEANWPNTNPNAYMAGDSTPTTFTVFFNQSGTAPTNLVTMTNNIKANLYSTVNGNSNIWAIQTNYEALMRLLIDNVINMISQTFISKPDYIIVNGIKVTNYDTLTKTFTFDNLFPLYDWTSHFTYEILYKIVKDSLGTIVDSITKGQFDVTINPAAIGPPTHYKDTFSIICWERELAFYNNGVKVNVINETMNNLELRYMYNEGAAKYNYKKADIEVRTAVGAVTDKENYSLVQNGTTFSRPIPRTILTSGLPTTDGTIQHLGADTFIVTFRNNEAPKLPLDTLQIKVPFRLTGSIEVMKAYYHDNNADGYVDSMYFVVTTDLAGGLTGTHVNQLKDSIILPAFRNLTITGQGVLTGGLSFYLTVNEDKSHNPFTYVTKDDTVLVKGCILPGGGWMIGKRVPIYDKIAPLIHWGPKKAFLVDHIIANMKDTLGVKFTEPVRYISSKEPFYFKSLEYKDIYKVILTPAGHPLDSPDSMFFTVDTVYCASNPNISAMKDGDSIWIYEGSRVGDVCLSDQGAETYNYQNNANNTRRRLYVERKSAPYVLIPNSISPLDLSNLITSIIPDNIIKIITDSLGQDFINNLNTINGKITGMLITLIPDFSDTLKIPKDFELKGNITIFDAVGNTVSPRYKMVWIKGKGLFWIWNAKNSNNRTVGPAMYLSVMEWEDVTPSTDPSKRKKGVKRLFVGVKQ